MRVLVTGTTGQAGSALVAAARADGHDVIAATRDGRGGTVAMPLEDPASVAGALREVRPDWIFHAAAMTDVDGCERDPAMALRINADATGAAASAAADVGAHMVYISTDYVFDGEKGRYVENDAPGPVNEYGRSKRVGEEAAASVLDDLIIARTSVLFSASHRNFVTWLVGALRAGQPVSVVADQWVSPTHADDLAAQILRLAQADARGTFHTAGAQRLGRLEMAHAVADHFGFDPSRLTPTTTARMDWKAQRPRDSSLDVTKVSRYAPPWTFSKSLATLEGAL